MISGLVATGGAMAEAGLVAAGLDKVAAGVPEAGAALGSVGEMMAVGAATLTPALDKLSSSI